MFTIDHIYKYSPELLNAMLALILSLSREGAQENKNWGLKFRDAIISTIVVVIVGRLIYMDESIPNWYALAATGFISLIGLTDVRCFMIEAIKRLKFK